MEFTLESDNINDYLQESNEVDYSNPIIQRKAEELFKTNQTDVEKIQNAFEFVRDEVSHSWDIQDELVTCHASEVLSYQKGICYAKSNLLAALLRSQGIPTGFCYQRLMLFDTPEKGYCIHALNAVYIISLNKWIRLDARGNKKGVNAQFSTDKEMLAFSVNPELDEIDYPIIFVEPNRKTIEVLRKHNNALEMYLNFLPDRL
ncbi:transglutaminase family protein [Rummeliibacillus sp. TYF005]|uniref:transglutaminase-like domain-containing protein n=1 Tax=unclassified Rummeliibacillus TaxID=2622809 RepID=UPI000E66F9A5|nr:MULTISPECIES: transglutaminase family protein [unclassified Rummeliibacillus]RIJ63245.1 transglutaminase family protein [Rummeliibacillus sp. POC4]RPJ96090.1 transglutaminase family protein [Rummeliibacillus sp. TYF005]